jgi:hypothetical protein
MPLYVIERNFAEQLEVTKEAADAVNVVAQFSGHLGQLRRVLDQLRGRGPLHEQCPVQHVGGTSPSPRRSGWSTSPST